jgi:LysR family hydrogen peroxide-inducible transcriptional activator
MTFKELHYFVTVAETRHFGRAAVLCDISQSTLSIQIGRLEDRLGVRLFQRNPIKLTECGVRVMPWARLMLVAADELAKAAKNNPADIAFRDTKINPLDLITKL